MAARVGAEGWITSGSETTSARRANTAAWAAKRSGDTWGPGGPGPSSAMRWDMRTTVGSGGDIALAPCLDDAPRADTVRGDVIEPCGERAADGPGCTAYEHAAAPQRVLSVLDARKAASRSRIGQRDEIERIGR